MEKEQSGKNGSLRAQPDNEWAQYIPERRTVQILDILKNISDEYHPVKQGEILEAMAKTGAATTGNAGTLASAIDEILLQINPVTYSKEDDDKYRIKYKGYQENRVLIKSEIKNSKKNIKNNNQPQRAPYITNLYYVHDFTYGELDSLIQAVSFSTAIAPEDKERLIGKLVNTSSRYYSTPYYNREKEKITFNPMGIYSRVHTRDKTGMEQLSASLNLIQDAINNSCQITFMSNEYGSDGSLCERYFHTISPYYIVVYHDMYYLIGGRTGSKQASHFRIDLITKVEYAVDANGNKVKIEPISQFGNLPKREQWNPEKYMSEHLYMSYGEPRTIKMRIPRDKYTVIHGWFGNNYRRCEKSSEDGYDIIEVVSSPDMIVHWAMQYAGIVEILDEDIRKLIKKEIMLLNEKY